MAESLIFYTNPMSRGQTIRWMLEEVGEPYDTEVLDYTSTMKAEPYLSINPMGKVPAIKHNGKVVTEVAAICCYLADAFPPSQSRAAASRPSRLLPLDLLHVGPGRSRLQQQGRGLGADPRAPAMFGYGNYDLAIANLEKALTGRDFIAADRFTAADLFVGANVNFMLEFKLLEPRPVFTDYAARMTDRDAYRRAKEIDGKLIAEMQAEASQPA